MESYTQETLEKAIIVKKLEDLENSQVSLEKRMDSLISAKESRQKKIQPMISRNKKNSLIPTNECTLDRGGQVFLVIGDLVQN